MSRHLSTTHSLCLAICTILCNLHLAAAEKALYTLPDLQALEKQQSWAELVDHLSDVAPKDRNQEWSRLAEQANLGLLQAVNEKEPLYGIRLSDAMLVSFPPLKNHAEFMKKRAEIGLKVLGECMDSDWLFAECEKKLHAMVDSDAKNRDFAIQAGKLVRRKGNHWIALPYFAKAVTKPGDALCKDEDVQMATFSALALPKDSNAAVVKAADTLAFQTCFAAMKEPLVNKFSEESGYFRDNTCTQLKAKGLLSNLQSKQCSTK